jgi:hypothetical protein
MPASGDLNSRTVAGLLAYCEYLMAKGYATPAQVNPWRTAIQRVFETVDTDGWESVDLATIELDDYLTRFQTLAGAAYKAESVAAYKRRIRNAIDAHEHYVATGRPPSFRQGGKRSARGEKSGVDGTGKGVSDPATPSIPSGSGLMEFPFPLAGGQVAQLRLPKRLRGDDVNRLSAFLRTLQDDSPEQRQLPQQSSNDEQESLAA